MRTMRKTAYVSPSKDFTEMSSRKVATLLVIFTLAVGFGFSQPARAQVAADNPARMLSNAENLGAEDLSKQITVTVWLRHHNQAAFDELVREIYDASSPNYHHFLTLEQYHANSRRRPGKHRGPGLPHSP